MATTHKPIGGSTIELAGLCSGSVKARQESPSISSPAAERGTRIHGYLEMMFEGEPIPSGADAIEILIARAAYDTICATLRDLGFDFADIKIEQNLPFQMFPTLAGGTSDQAGHQAFGDMFIGDLKTGNGQVEAQDSYQMLFYAVTYLESLPAFVRGTLKDCHLFIFQPEQEAPYTCAVRKWTLPVAKVWEFRHVFADIVQGVIDKPDERTPGDHCQKMWCPARGVCPVYSAWLNDLTGGQLEQVITTGVVPQSRGERLMMILRNADKIIDMVDSAKTFAVALKRECPEELPEVVLKDNHSREAWENAEVTRQWCAEQGLSEDVYAPREMLSPSQLKKLPQVADKQLPATFKTVTSQSIKIVPVEKQDPFAAFAPEAAVPAPKKRASRAKSKDKPAATPAAELTQPETAAIGGK